MMTVLQVASYISNRYTRDTRQLIDEMKLHKLLYFSQREAFVFFDKPMFNEQFVAWKYGPVMLPVRDNYKHNKLTSLLSCEEKTLYSAVFDSVFSRYASKPSWSLSTLSHGEYSWQNARIGLAPDVNGHNMMNTEDIRKDAARIRLRRMLIENK